MNITVDSKPWYKYPLLWMMLAIPFIAVVRGVWMIWISVETADGLVTDDYYKQGKAINEVLVRDKKAAELGLSAIIDFDITSKAINLQFNKGLLEYYPQSLNLHIQHATREKNDITVLMHRGIGDRYIGHVKYRISKGIWYFGIGNEEWKLNARTYVQPTNTINLQSKY
jgi:hypothetical protein